MSKMLSIIKQLKSVPDSRWFGVVNKKGEDMTHIIKQLIDGNEPFTFSDDYKKFKRIEDPFLK